MNQKIEPALSAEEWRMVRAMNEAMYDGPPWALVMEGLSTAGNIAALNASLPDSDTRKITRAWVDAIRSEANAIEARHDDGPERDEMALYERFTLLNAMANALESYLPPA